MKIKSIAITNIKSFKYRTLIELDSAFNIIIGPNASGKSNLLDILTISLRRFFLFTYSKEQEHNRNFRIQQNVSFNDISTQLEKYIGNDISSEIEFVFSVQQEDIDNIKIFKEEKNKFVQLLKSESTNSEHIINTFESIQWDESLFEVGELMPYKIIDNQLNINNSYPIPDLQQVQNTQSHKENIFLKYLNFHQLFILFQQIFPEREFKPFFLFLSPYRSASTDQDFLGNLSQNNSITLANSLINITSKQSSSLIRLATTYFSEKLREFERKAKTDGYEKMWENDKEVKLVSNYLNRLGYNWTMNLVNSNQNVYEIQLEKQGQRLSLSQASSGEKEIINYLFGIFALKIANGLIIIDEPELHLHPRWQLLLLDLFVELTNKTGNQFIITTHSAVFININSVTNLIRVYRKDNESKHVALKDKNGIDLKNLLHLINSTNNEKIFFADLVILVEGITDRLVFQKIVSLILSKYNVLSVVEVVEINGKGNIKRFREYLNILEIPYCFIADLDYVNQVGTKAIKDLFVTNNKAIDNDAIKNPKSTDGKKLIEILESAIQKNDISLIPPFLEYIKTFRRKLKDNLSDKEKLKLSNFINSRHIEHEYILFKGDIESYFPPGLSAKDLDNVIELLKEPHFSKWQKSQEYQLLEEIILDILRAQNLIS